MCVCIFIKLHITAQSDPVILVIVCVCVCVCACLFFALQLKKMFMLCLAARRDHNGAERADGQGVGAGGAVEGEIIKANIYYELDWPRN